MSSTFLGKPNLATAKWIKEHQPLECGLFMTDDPTFFDDDGYRDAYGRWIFKWNEQHTQFQNHSTRCYITYKNGKWNYNGQRPKDFKETLPGARTLTLPYTATHDVIFNWYAKEEDMPMPTVDGVWHDETDNIIFRWKVMPAGYPYWESGDIKLYSISYYTFLRKGITVKSWFVGDETEDHVFNSGITDECCKSFTILAYGKTHSFKWYKSEADIPT